MKQVTKVNSYSRLKLSVRNDPESIKERSTARFWEKKENILHFLKKIKVKYNLNSPEDWNSITKRNILLHGGRSLLRKYSMFDLKCMACPEGKSMFKNSPQAAGYWEKKENIDNFLSKIKEKYNLKSPEDWNSITCKHIKGTGGSTLLKKYSMFDLKCMACPEGKASFNNPLGFWENQENIHKFLFELKAKYNLNNPEDWNSITTTQIISNGGRSLLSKYSIFELKCIACPEGKSMYNNPYLSTGYWENKENIDNFLSKIKEKYNLKTIEDWKRISRNQITSSEGGWSLLNSKYFPEIELKFDGPNQSTILVPLTQLISKANYKRSSQRWLFLQVQKLFPGEEIVEDYFHSELSRISGFNIQFDIFMVHKNIAIEYHGKQHYEDIPGAFGNVETYKCRDLEKEKLCKEHEIQLVVIPYWWDNKLDSLKTYLYSKNLINK